MKIPAVKTQTKFWAFNGGLDLTSPMLESSPGTLRSGVNVEIGINGGYSRVAGYERYSGKAKPSSASYSILTCSVTGVAVGDVLTDDTGTSYGTVIALPTGQAVLTLITGSFSTGNVKVGGVTKGTCTGAQLPESASTRKLHATYLNLAADVYRALIDVVPGTGPILGVYVYNSRVYAFRNNAGQTAAVFHVALSTGWTEVPLYNEISFTSATGTATIVDGGTLSKGGVTALIKRVVVQSGSLAAGTAAGRLIIGTPSGGSFTAGAATVGAGTLTLSGAQTAISFLPNGRFEFDTYNFGGGTRTKCMYGCDGINRAFEYDGDVLVPLTTGMPTDTPSHIKAHKNHLFLSFASSVQHSGVSTPYTWTAISGAAEIGCGDIVTGMLPLPGSETSGAFLIKTKNRSLVLYGNDVSDWNLVSYSEESGAVEHTLQFITQAVCLDSSGIVLLATSQNYGNFQSASVSNRITPSLNTLMTSANASCVSRLKNQYRLFFLGGGAFYMTFLGGKIQGITQIDMPNDVACITSQEGESAAEEIYFGSSDGMVYQMEKGTSFDGEAITWNAYLSYNHLGSPRNLKQFRKGATEVVGTSYAEFSFSYGLGYDSTNFSPAIMTDASIEEAGESEAWDFSYWDQFAWDGTSLVPYEADITGLAESISLYFQGSSDEFAPFTLRGQILHYTNRRDMR